MNSEISPLNIYHPEKVLKLELSKYAIIILNQKILHPMKFFASFWNKASIRITVDGGTNRWYRYIKEHRLEYVVTPIDIVTGDFDSITQSSIRKAMENGARVINTHDQDETDFTKAIKVLKNQCEMSNIELKHIYVICQSSGRLDQIFANVNTLFTCSDLKFNGQSAEIFLFSNDSLSWFLKSGKHKIHIPDSLKRSKNAWCGLIPVGEKCSSVTTKGLKWNLNQSEMSFGSLISTSNTFDGSDFVIIENKSPLIWCMGILPIFHDIYGTLDVEQ